MEPTIGEAFQKGTAYIRENLPQRPLDFSRKPPPHKAYPHALRTMLPPPVAAGNADLWDLLARRRSERRYGATPLSMENLSQLLWAAQGVTAQAGQYLLRTAPSAGALNPVETYLAINQATDISPGIYHYAAPEHALEHLTTGKPGPAVARACLHQRIVEHAATVFLWSAVLPRCRWKYGERAFRYIYLDGGHVAQNLYLACTALGLSCCTIGAFFDDELNALLGLDGNEETIIYAATVGHPAE